MNIFGFRGCSHELASMPILSSYVIFIVYLFFCFYSNFELLINTYTVKFYKMTCSQVIIIKAHRV